MAGEGRSTALWVGVAGAAVTGLFFVLASVVSGYWNARTNDRTFNQQQKLTQMSIDGKKDEDTKAALSDYLVAFDLAFASPSDDAKVTALRAASARLEVRAKPLVADCAHRGMLDIAAMNDLPKDDPASSVTVSEDDFAVGPPAPSVTASGNTDDGRVSTMPAFVAVFYFRNRAEVFRSWVVAPPDSPTCYFPTRR